MNVCEIICTEDAHQLLDACRILLDAERTRNVRLENALTSSAQLRKQLQAEKSSAELEVSGLRDKLTGLEGDMEELTHQQLLVSGENKKLLQLLQRKEVECEKLRSKLLSLGYVVNAATGSNNSATNSAATTPNNTTTTAISSRRRDEQLGRDLHGDLLLTPMKQRSSTGSTSAVIGYEPVREGGAGVPAAPSSVVPESVLDDMSSAAIALWSSMSAPPPPPSSLSCAPAGFGAGVCVGCVQLEAFVASLREEMMSLHRERDEMLKLLARAGVPSQTEQQDHIEGAPSPPRNNDFLNHAARRLSLQRRRRSGDDPLSELMDRVAKLGSDGAQHTSTTCTATAIEATSEVKDEALKAVLSCASTPLRDLLTKDVGEMPQGIPHGERSSSETQEDLSDSFRRGLLELVRRVHALDLELEERRASAAAVEKENEILRQELYRATHHRSSSKDATNGLEHDEIDIPLAIKSSLADSTRHDRGKIDERLGLQQLAQKQRVTRHMCTQTIPYIPLSATLHFSAAAGGGGGRSVSPWGLICDRWKKLQLLPPGRQGPERSVPATMAAATSAPSSRSTSCTKQPPPPPSTAHGAELERRADANRRSTAATTRKQQTGSSLRTVARTPSSSSSVPNRLVGMNTLTYRREVSSNAVPFR